MATKVKDFQYVGKGVVTIKEFGTTDTPTDLGNVLEFKMAVTEVVKEQPNMRDASGGNAATLRKVSKVELTLKMGEWSPTGLALVTGGELDSIVTGTPPADTTAHTIELFVNSPKLWELKFTGLNEMNSGSAVVATFYKGRMGYAESFSFLSDDITNLDVKVSCEADSTKTGVGVSKYGKIEMAA